MDYVSIRLVKNAVLVTYDTYRGGPDDQSATYSFATLEQALAHVRATFGDVTYE